MKYVSIETRKMISQMGTPLLLSRLPPPPNMPP